MKHTRILFIIILCSVYGFCSDFSLTSAQGPELMEIRYKNESWLPVPYTTVTVEFRIRSEANCSSADVTAFLANITNYNGELGNSGNVRGTQNDMRLKASSNSDWTENSPNSITRTISQSETYYPIVINCYDYAAYAEITVSVTCGSITQTKTLKLPKDDNGNKIADKWENDNNIYTSNTSNAQALVRKDTDPGPNPNLTGDGISVFDEYRGFMLQKGNTNTNEFKRLDPNKPEFFVSWAANATHKNAGVGDAMKLPGNLTARLVRRADLHTDASGKMLNPIWTNTGSQTIYAVRITENATGTDSTYPNALGTALVGPPSSASEVTLYLSRITGTKIEIFTQIQDVLAHELGHSVNLNHCPVDNSQACYMWNEYQQWTHYMAHHNRDYDVSPASPNNAPQKEFKTTQSSTPQNPVSPPSSESSSDSSEEDDHCPPSGSVTQISGPPVWGSESYRAIYRYAPGRDLVANPIIENVLNLSWSTKPAEDWYRSESDGGPGYYMTVPSHDGFSIDEDGVGWFHTCDYSGNYSGSVATDQDLGFSIVSISPETPMFDTVDFRRDFYPYIINDGGEMYLQLDIQNIVPGNTYTLTLRARNSEGYADQDYVIEFKDEL